MTATDGQELSLTRLIDAPRQKLWRCWTEPELIKLWFCPLPWKVVEAEMDLRAGGGSRFVMQGPNGERHDSRGVYLEVVEGERLVFTDAMLADWAPSEKPFMIGIIEFADEDGKTRYTARCRHWTAEDRETHEKMGFHEGWGKATDQLAELAKTI